MHLPSAVSWRSWASRCVQSSSDALTLSLHSWAVCLNFVICSSDGAAFKMNLKLKNLSEFFKNVTCLPSMLQPKQWIQWRTNKMLSFWWKLIQTLFNNTKFETSTESTYNKLMIWMIGRYRFYTIFLAK